MNIKKIKNKINNFFNKTEKKSSNSKLVLNNIDRTPFTKKRRTFVIKNDQIEKLKIFWNNIAHYYLMILFILVILTLFIIFWPMFKIKFIEIVKKDNITNMTISYKSVEDYRWLSIWNTDKKDVLKSLRNYQQNIHDIKLDIVLPSTLKITIDAYKWVFNTKINWKTYIITENWSLIPASYSTDLKELVVKSDFDKSKFLDYKQILEWEYIQKINLTKEFMKQNFINIKIQSLIYYEIERELHIKTDKNTTIIFDLDWDIKEQIKKLAIFNKEHVDLTQSPIIYIDLRINNKIFYCTEEEKYQCETNLKSIYSE